MTVVNEAIESARGTVPGVHRELAGDECRASVDTIIEDFR